jgi:bifunctional DNase/RNase
LLVGELVELKVQAVVIEGVAQPVVLLHDAEGKRSFSILIGPAEAMAISIQLAGEKPQRPLTHDLLRSVLDQLNAKVTRVVITELRDSTYYAQINLHTKAGDHTVDSRPSDAIALALRTESPIFISEALLTQIEGEQALERQGFVVDSGSETVH